VGASHQLPQLCMAAAEERFEVPLEVSGNLGERRQNFFS
jgi:hypothetical protein